MRGSLSIEEAFQLDHEDRSLMFTLIEENLETTKKTGLNFFQIILPKNLLSNGKDSAACCEVARALRLATAPGV